MKMIELFEDVLFVPQLPPKFGNSNYKEKGGEVVTTSPQKFLAAAMRLNIDVGAQNKIDQLKIKMKAGDAIDPPVLFIKDGKVFKHDGRHRAEAAMQLGIKSMDVIVIPVEGKFTKTVRAQKTDKVVEL